MGGDTVTSIAAQRDVEQPIFWVASNSNFRYQARDFLTWLLGCLGRLYSSGGDPTAEVESEIWIRCIEKSAPRIKSYTFLLLKAIDEAERSIGHPVSSEGQCFHLQSYSCLDDSR